MILKTIKELEQVIKLCKKQGIQGLRVGNVEFALSENPKAIKLIDTDAFPEAQAKVPKFNGRAFNDKPDDIKTDTLSEAQLRDWSVQPEPGSEEAQ